MHCLVIGYGSIGKRHAAVLKSLDCQVSLVTAQEVNDYISYTSVEEALQKAAVDYVVIANPTHKHYSALLSLIHADYRGVVLVEKPLFAKSENLPINNIKKIAVAYNLRFHELLIEAKELLKHEEILTFTAYVSQYLPKWRKDCDYRKSYSAKKEYGGGVVRELSHELDYATWFCGNCIELTALGGHVSHLEVTSDDVYSVIMHNKYCPVVTLHLNCLDRVARREIIINTNNKTVFIDLINGILKIDHNIIKQSKNEIAQTYIRQHQMVLDSTEQFLCTYNEGMAIMRLIEAIELASQLKQWVTV